MGVKVQNRGQDNVLLDIGTMCAMSVMICAQIMHLIHDDVFALVQQDDRLVRLANPFCKVTFQEL